jgi:hypothetical protein
MKWLNKISSLALLEFSGACGIERDQGNYQKSAEYCIRALNNKKIYANPQLAF